jgi:hypothetical protein
MNEAHDIIDKTEVSQERNLNPLNDNRAGKEEG